MTDYFVDDGGDNSDGLTWEKAFITLAGAIAAAGSSDAIWVVKDHLETATGHVTYAFPEDPAITVICLATADRDTGGTTIATLATMADDATEGWTADGNYEIRLEGCVYGYGLTFQAGSSAANSSARVQFGVSTSLTHNQLWENCVFGSRSTSANINTRFGQDGDQIRIEWKDCTFKTAGTGQSLEFVKGRHHINNLKLGAVVVNLIYAIDNVEGNVTIENSDLSVNPPSGALMERNNDSGNYVVIRNTTLALNQTLVAGSADRWGGDTIELFNCDDGDTNYRYALDSPMGTIDTETTITRTGGAEHDGTQYSFKYISNANPTLHMPLEGPEFVIGYGFKVGETLGIPITVTVQLTGSELLQNDDIWMEAQYLGTSGFPLGLSDTNKVALLGSPANLPNAATAWDSASVQDMQLVLDFTPQEVGFIHLRVMLAKPSITVYVDPLAVIS